MNILKTLAISAIFGVAAASQATLITWSLNMPSGNVGSSSHTYLDTTNVYDVVAHGYSTADAAPVYSHGETWTTGSVSNVNLYGKNDGAGETGLGLNGQSDNEVDNKHFIQLDTHDIKAAGLTNFTFSIGSEQSGEGYVIWGSNTAGAAGVALYNGTGTPVTLSQAISSSDYSSYRYFSISASSSKSGNDLKTDGNLVLGGVSAQAVPEPVSMFALATGAIALLRKRK
jgi:hypothetical protein